MANEMTPYLEPGDHFSAVAVGAVTGKRFTVKDAVGTGQAADGRPTYKRSGAAPDLSAGVASYDAADGEPFVVQAVGVVPVTSGAAIASGSPVTSDNQGRAVTATAGQLVLGEAWNDVGAAGSDTMVRLVNYRLPAA